MIGFIKSVQAVFQSVLAEVPEGLRVVLDFIWKARWFIVVGWILYSLYQMVMVTLPYLMWSWVIKSVMGSLFSLLS